MPIIEHADYYETPMYGVSHSHTYCEIMYIVCGRVTVEADGREYILTAGHSLLIKRRCHHTSRAAADIDYKRFIAVVNPWETRKQLVRPDLFTLLTDTGREGAVHLGNARGLLPGFERMREIFLSGGNVYDELAAALTGMSHREYLTHIRCTRAYELIRHTDMKFAVIAGNTGFCCANDMSRKIREFYGKTPTDIRFGK